MFASVIVVLACCVLGLALVQAYKARSISDELSESFYIGLSMFGAFQALAIGLPVQFLVEENTTASFFLKAGLIFLVSISILLLVFLPKILQAHSTPKQDSRPLDSSFNRIYGRKLSSQGQSVNRSDDGLRFTSSVDRLGSEGEDLEVVMKRLTDLETENARLLLENLQLKRSQGEIKQAESSQEVTKASTQHADIEERNGSVFEEAAQDGAAIGVN